MNIRINLSHFFYGATNYFRLLSARPSTALFRLLNKFICLFESTSNLHILRHSRESNRRNEASDNNGTAENRWKSARPMRTLIHSSFLRPHRSLLSRSFRDDTLIWRSIDWNSPLTKWMTSPNYLPCTSGSNGRRFGGLSSINTFDCVPRSTWIAFVASPVTLPFLSHITLDYHSVFLYFRAPRVLEMFRLCPQCAAAAKFAIVEWIAIRIYFITLF